MSVASKTKVENFVVPQGTSYTKVPLSMIRVVERPKEGEQKLFYNPRSPESVVSSKLTDLKESIRTKGLEEALSIRVRTDDGKRQGKLSGIDLIAG